MPIDKLSSAWFWKWEFFDETLANPIINEIAQGFNNDVQGDHQGAPLPNGSKQLHSSL